MVSNVFWILAFSFGTLKGETKKNPKSLTAEKPEKRKHLTRLKEHAFLFLQRIKLSSDTLRQKTYH